MVQSPIVFICTCIFKNFKDRKKLKEYFSTSSQNG